MLKNKGGIGGFAPAAQERARVKVMPAGQDKIRSKIQKVFVLTPEQNRQLKDYCNQTDSTVQAVTIEGINMVLRSKGLPELV